MKHRWKMAGIAALVVVLFSGSPARAHDPELSPKTALADLRKEIRELKEEINLLRRTALRDSELADKELRLLHERMAHIEDSLARLSPGASTRGASSFTPATPAPGVPMAPVQTGTLRLYNTMETPATVVVEGVAYNVPALSEMNLRNVPAGPITYQVSSTGGVAPAVRSTIVANERLTVRIFPLVRVIPIE